MTSIAIVSRTLIIIVKIGTIITYNNNYDDDNNKVIGMVMITRIQ